MPKPEIGQEDWGTTLNTYLDTLAADVAAKATAAEVADTYVASAPAAAGGGVDDTTTLQTRLDAGSLTLRPNSTYRVTALTVPAGFVLDLNGSTLIKHSGAANLVTLSGAGASLLRGTLDGNALGGSLVRVTAADVVVRDILAQNGTDVGFDCNAATRPRLTNCSSDGVKYGVLLNNGTTDAQVNGGYHRNGTSTEHYSGSFYTPVCSRSVVTGVTVEGAASHGFYDQGTDNTFINCIARNNGTGGGSFDHRGVTVDTATRSTWIGCRFIGNVECGFYDRSTSIGTRLTDCTAEGNNTSSRPGGHGFEMLGQNSTLTGCVALGQLGNVDNSGGGFYMGTSGDVTGCRSDGNWGHGFRAYNSVAVAFSGCTATNNNQSGTTHDGFNLSGDYPGATVNTTLTGCHAYDTQATKTQRYGCSITNAPDYYTVTGNILRAAQNLTGGFSDTGGANKVVANNLTT